MTERMEQLYLEDLRVGQRFTSGTYVMEAARIKAFAAEFDPQPFHLDESAAQASIFKGLAASGWHTAAVAMRLLVTGGLAICERHRRPGRRNRLATTDTSWRHLARRK